MAKYTAKYIDPIIGTTPTNWVKVGNVAVDVLGIATSADLPFSPGVDNSHGNGYIIISDTSTTGLVGRTTGGGSGNALGYTPTYWATGNKFAYNVIDFVKKLPNPLNLITNINNIQDVDDFLSSNSYWWSYDATLSLLIDIKDLVCREQGTPLRDLSGNGLEYQSYVNYVSSSLVSTYAGIYALLFNGNAGQEWVDIGTPIPSITTNGGGYTIMAWVVLDDPNWPATGARNIVSSENSPFWVSNGILMAGVDGEYSVVQSPSTLPNNVWKFVAVTYTNPGTMKLYIDGVLVNENTWPSTLNYSSQNTFIGSHFSSGINVSFWMGAISEVTIYVRPLTGNEILEEFNYKRNTYGI